MTELPDLGAVILLSVAAFVAGFVDAIAGGGGLIQVPSLLSFAPGLPVATVLGTNKLSSLFGTGGALMRFRALGLVRIREWWFAIAAAGVGGALGALVAASIDSSLLRPLVVGLTFLVLLYVLLGSGWTSDRVSSNKGSRLDLPVGAQIALGSAAGTYDGFYGPGAGSFLIAGLVKLCKVDALKASAYAKTMNLASNFGALLWFVVVGHVSIKLGLIMAAFNLMGGTLGSSLAGRVGPRLVRGVLSLVVLGLLVKLTIDMLQ